MKKRWQKLFYILMISGVFAYVVFYLIQGDSETYSYHGVNPTAPELQFQALHPDIRFTRTHSSLILQSKNRDKYEIRLKVESEMSQQVDVRQDFSLVYANGHLLGILHHWTEPAVGMVKEISLKGEGSTRFDVISYHHAEIQEADRRFSQYEMSYDRVYLLSSAITQSSLFREPQTNTQTQWKRILDHAIQQQWNYLWNHLMHHFQIDQEQYELIPIHELIRYQEQTLPSLTAEETRKVIGYIWEALYLHYLMPSSTTEQSFDPQGSFLPLILIDKAYEHVLILCRTESGEEIMIHFALTDTL